LLLGECRGKLAMTDICRPADFRQKYVQIHAAKEVKETVQVAPKKTWSTPTRYSYPQEFTCN